MGWSWEPGVESWEPEKIQYAIENRWEEGRSDDVGVIMSKYTLQSIAVPTYVCIYIMKAFL